VSEIDYRKAFAEALAKPVKPNGKMVPKRTQMAQDAPAPAIQALVDKNGKIPTAKALEAWDARVRGARLVDLSHEMGISIESVKLLIKEAHDAIHEDLKANLEQNRQLDLDRIDGLLGTYYPAAKQGDPDCANVVLKCLAQRSKLTGIEPPPDPGRSNPQNVLVWIQNQLPSINRLVDSLPLELPPGAPV
jgi:hypothetical protein